MLDFHIYHVFHEVLAFWLVSKNLRHIEPEVFVNSSRLIFVFFVLTVKFWVGEQVLLCALRIVQVIDFYNTILFLSMCSRLF